MIMEILHSHRVGPPEEKLRKGDEVRWVPVGEPKKPGRNQPCPCRSGRKYKRCCGAGA